MSLILDLEQERDSLLAGRLGKDQIREWIIRMVRLLNQYFGSCDLPKAEFLQQLQRHFKEPFDSPGIHFWMDMENAYQTLFRLSWDPEITALQVSFIRKSFLLENDLKNYLNSGGLDQLQNPICDPLFKEIDHNLELLLGMPEGDDDHIWL